MVGGAGLLGSLAAITLPATSNAPEIAAVLAVAALALLAGHQWGVIVVVVADVVLLGRLWPLVVYQWPPSLEVQMAAYAAIVGTLPGVFLLRRTIPNSLELVLGRMPSQRLQAIGTAVATACGALWLVVPTLWP